MTKKIPSLLDTLLDGNELQVYTDVGDDKQLKAARCSKGLVLIFGLGTIEEPADADEWTEVRRGLGTGKVLCPECDSSGDDPDGCGLCEGHGMISRDQWDEWYFQEKGCRDDRVGCEKTCERHHCNRDEARLPVGHLVMKLRARVLPDNKEPPRGNSVDGYKLDGLCKNPAALLRYINAVAWSCGCIDFALDDEDEESDGA